MPNSGPDPLKTKRPVSELNGLARDLSEGRTDTVTRLFAAHDCAAPSIVWQPGTRDLRQPVIARFAKAISPHQRVDGSLSERTVERIDLADVAPWVMELEPVQGGEDFRYLRYGDEIASVFGSDLTGKCTSAIGGHVSAFFIAMYQAVLHRKEWVLSRHEPPSVIFARQWHRLIVPVLTESGVLVRLLAVNVPDNELRPGLEAVPDPVLLVQDDRRVLYANSAAQALFGPRAFGADPIDADAYCGFVLSLPERGALRASDTREARAIGQQGSLVVQFVTTCRTIHYRDRLCHVVVVKPS